MEMQSIVIEEKSEIKQKPSKRKRIRKLFRNILFSIAWFYICISIFYANPDTMIVMNYNLMDVGAYASIRILLMIFIIMSFWMIVGNKKFWKLIGLFFLFPIYPVLLKTAFIVIFYPLTYLIEIKWYSILYSYIELLAAFFFKFKQLIFRFSLLLLCIFLLVSLPDNFQIITIIMFAILQLMHLISRVNEVKEPFRILQFPVQEIEELIKDPNTPSKLDEIISGESKDVSSINEKGRIEQFEVIVLINEFTKIFKLRIKEILTRRTYIMSFVWKYIYSCALAMVYFGAMNYGLFKYSPDQYIVTSNPNYFEFFYYSFFTIFPDTTSIVPVDVLSKILRMTGVFVGVFLNALLFIVFITSNGERFKESLTSLLHSIETYSGEIQSYFMAKHGMSYIAILSILKSAGSQIERFINKS